MSIAVKRRAGQPVIALAMIILLWVGLRTVLWQSPFSAILPLEIPASLPVFAKADVTAGKAAFKSAKNGEPRYSLAATPTLRSALTAFESASGPAGMQWPEALLTPEDHIEYARPTIQHSNAAAHQMLWIEALARLPLPAKYARIIRPNRRREGVAGRPPRAAAPLNKTRWSFDSWAFYRAGGVAAGGNAGPLPASYGASQAGGVLRYSLTPRDRNNAKAYVRVTAALSGVGGGDIAAGLSARPIQGLPVSVQGEMRISRVAGKTETRPAVLAVTEFPPAKLPLGMQAEIYAQGGYVGGDFATPFADGQAKIDREVASFELGNARVGAGIWGGAQKGAERLDIGPSASVVVPIANGTARLSVDYRHRIAGDASPPSGIAITLSTGF